MRFEGILLVCLAHQAAFLQLPQPPPKTEILQLQQESQECQARLGQLEDELRETKDLLSQVVHALAKVPDGTGEVQREKRDTSDGGGSHDDVLSSLSLHDNMIPLLSRCSCRDGKDGKDGKDGVNGRDGRDGAPGQPGEKGARGEAGEPGETVTVRSATNEASSRPIDREDGAQEGSAGREGAQGPPGAQGVQGIPGLPGPPADTGSIYTRWGRTTCPGNTSIIYEGFMAGTHHTATGGGANYQCLPLTPEYGDYVSGGSFGVISGTEYQDVQPVFPSANDQNVPCVRCYSVKSAMMMLPARLSCPDQWQREYTGYLMAEHSGHNSPSTYECIDGSPEYISGAGANTNGALLYFVKPDCSGDQTISHCPPYDANKQLRCVICVR